MAISFVQSASGLDTSTGALSTTATFNAASAGNLLVGAHALQNLSEIVTPHGWTVMLRLRDGANFNAATFYRVATGGETSVVFSTTAGTRQNCVFTEYTGTLTSGVFSSSATVDMSGAVTTLTSGTISTVSAIQLVVALFVVDASTNANGRSFTNGYSERVSSTGASTMPGIYLADSIYTSLTSNVSTRMNWSGADQAIGFIAGFIGLADVVSIIYNQALSSTTTGLTTYLKQVGKVQSSSATATLINWNTHSKFGRTLISAATASPVYQKSIGRILSLAATIEATLSKSSGYIRTLSASTSLGSTLSKIVAYARTLAANTTITVSIGKAVGKILSYVTNQIASLTATEVVDEEVVTQFYVTVSVNPQNEFTISKPLRVSVTQPQVQVTVQKT